VQEHTTPNPGTGNQHGNQRQGAIQPTRAADRVIGSHTVRQILLQESKAQKPIQKELKIVPPLSFKRLIFL
jgi:hypothetical protein